MKPILYTTLITMFYYLALIFAANKIMLKKYNKTNTEDSTEAKQSNHMLLAVNLNIIFLLFLTHDSVMNYITYLIGDESGFFTILSSGSLLILVHGILLFISYIISKFLYNIIGKNAPSFLHPILWITINLILLKLTFLYYEAYISTQGFTIL
ncbi:hypothetical protein [Cellulophaga tyrosinoxydans]|jgi:hypothetical protein|uniref:Uncharacterized protein n=1 Tax=Cellulophaga tyrosinoxydans TaxID=504486 RepID=A0A1W1ZZ57_9FLAO|nr:hypothetical protein [Cellulophaga tyrosinoxydans]SMC53769.1 hypothetical protein SAMN05660703_1672 [Cellulophaga tyrosinoxydans]